MPTAPSICRASSNPYAIPLGGLIPYIGASAPNSAFALPYGQAISRTTYAALFALVGTTFGSGDGSTTFNLPDLRGRVIAALDNMGGSAAGRIGTVSTDSGTIVGSTLGSAGGSATHVQTTTEMAQHTHTASVTDPGHSHPAPSGSTGNFLATSGTSGGAITAGDIVAAFPATGTATTGVTVSNSNTGGGSAMAWLQPTLISTLFFG